MCVWCVCIYIHTYIYIYIYTHTSSCTTSWQIQEEKVEVVTDFLFLGSKIAADGDCSHEIRWLLLSRKAMRNLDSMFENQRHYSANKVQYSQALSGHIQLWELNCKESGRVPKNWCFQTVVVEKTPECPLDCKETKAVNLKGNQP